MSNVSRRLLFRWGAAAATTRFASAAPEPSPEQAAGPFNVVEPDLELAKLWWPDERNVWTAIGWKDHYFRFNVVYNGTVICEPCPHFAPMRPHAKRWLGQSFQLTFAPTADGMPPPLPAHQTQLWRMDGGHGMQGWNTEHATPLLWTEWRLDAGVVIRQEIFSHVAGGEDVKTGIEPHYAWIRLRVAHVDELRAPRQQDVSIQLTQVYYKHAETYKNEDGITIDAVPALAPYPKSLRAEEQQDVLRILEPDGKVRLTVLPHQAGKVSFFEASPGNRIYALKVQLNAVVDEHIDLLVPMLPAQAADMEAEESLGRDAALLECNRYWSQTPASAAKIHIPEKPFDDVIARSIKFADIIAERDYENGDYTYLTGSWGYDNLWSTPSSMTAHMFLSLLGYHESVARHIELFRKHQGSVKPPGPSYEIHPGYFSTPRTLTAFDWLTDHGAILLEVSTHALLSNDSRFISDWTPSILKACDFIQDSCKRTDHDGVPGLLPPAVATDDLIPTQTVYALAWNYKGLCSAVRLLKRIDHPRAAEFDEFAKRYQKTFADAFHERAANAPQWTDASGQKRRKPPTTLSTKPMPHHSFSDAFYLDGGPMVAVWAGLLNAGDELMRDCVQFFREGPDTLLYGVNSNPLSRPVLLHEISSCEPCYSWNIVNSWQLNDRPRFLEGVYSLFGGAMSQQTYSACEHRHGIQTCQCPTYFGFYLARLSVIDDELAERELHLLRLCPLAWIKDGEDTVFERMPTLYGQVNLRFRLADAGKTLTVTFSGNWRSTRPRVVLHAPPLALERITVNGKSHPARNQIVI